jgi:hypothetical protein
LTISEIYSINPGSNIGICITVLYFQGASFAFSKDSFSETGYFIVRINVLFGWWFFSGTNGVKKAILISENTRKALNKSINLFFTN